MRCLQVEVALVARGLVDKPWVDEICRENTTSLNMQRMAKAEDTESVLCRPTYKAGQSRTKDRKMRQG